MAIPVKENGPRRAGSLLALFTCIMILVGAEFLASLVQCDFGGVRVQNVRYRNFNGIPIRAKLFKPVGATRLSPLPGAVYIHGYQNNRETGDAYCLELARRGFVVLNIDAIGRGNSGIPNDPGEPDFDPTYGARTSLDYLRSLPFVRKEAVGMMGHSLGAEMAYRVALGNPHVQALVITGFAYTEEATPSDPKNMLMIMGKWDEFRKRMTGTRDLEKEWMATAATRAAFGMEHPALNKTYGDFAAGTARRVFIPPTIHIQESHSAEAIAQALSWMREALSPPKRYWKDEKEQIWQIKEWATLVAMLACFASLLPLGSILLSTRFFSSLRGDPTPVTPAAGGTFWRFFLLNGLLSWLYLPLIFVLFGVHVYLVHIDKAFPLMMVNGILWWFFWVNVIGFLLARRWARKKGPALTPHVLGVSFSTEGLTLDGKALAKTFLLGLILFTFAYLVEHLLERFFIVDFRFIFPFASDLTPYRAWVSLRYLPFVVAGFLCLGYFLHGIMRPAPGTTPVRTFFRWSIRNLFIVLLPLVLFLMIQYVPLFASGWIPFVGPGGMFVSFVINLFHVIGVLFLVIPLSTWFFQQTGKIYLGAFVSALLVIWMFLSSQVIAPIPV